MEKEKQLTGICGSSKNKKDTNEKDAPDDKN